MEKYEKKFKRFLNEEKPGPGTLGSIKISINDDEIQAIEKGEITLPDYNIDGNELWVWEDDYEDVSNKVLGENEDEVLQFEKIKYFDEDGNPIEVDFSNQLKSVYPNFQDEVKNYMNNHDEGFANLLSQIDPNDSPKEIYHALVKSFEEYVGMPEYKGIEQNLKEDLDWENSYDEEDEDEFGDEDTPGLWATTDGWNEDYFEEVGLMDFIKNIERVAYEIRNARRGSYGLSGDTLEDLKSDLLALKDEFDDVINNLMD